MADTAIERVIELTESVLQNTYNDEHKFKLRAAVQLLQMIHERHDGTNAVLADSDLDDQVRANLQELGYLE